MKSLLLMTAKPCWPTTRLSSKLPAKPLKSAIVADDAAGTVTMTLAQPWGPFLPTIANGWGSIMDKEWVIENGGWDGTCDTWQNFYGMVSADNPFTTIANGTGPFKLDHWNQGVEVSMLRNDGILEYPRCLGQVLIQDVSEFGTRFAMLQAGDADVIAVPAEYRTQVDPLVGVATCLRCRNQHLPAPNRTSAPSTPR